MIDIIFLVTPLVVTATIVVRRTSAGVAVLALLAGVMLDQLLATWIVSELPNSPASFGEYIPLSVRVAVTLVPALVSMLAVRVVRQNIVLSLLTSLLLGFLGAYYTLQILASIASIAQATHQAGLLNFVKPYQNEILAASAVLAIVEMVASHRSGIAHNKRSKKKKKND